MDMIWRETVKDLNASKQENNCTGEWAGSLEVRKKVSREKEKCWKLIVSPTFVALKDQS